MLRYEGVLWQYTGKPRKAHGEHVNSGLGTVRTDASRVMVYENASAQAPSYTLACHGIEGTFPLNTEVTLPRYTLRFTRAPTHEHAAGTSGTLAAAAAATTPAAERRPSVAGFRIAAGPLSVSAAAAPPARCQHRAAELPPPASISSAATLNTPAGESRLSVADAQFVAAATVKHKTVAVETDLPPLSPPRGPVPGQVSGQHRALSAALGDLEPKTTKRRRTAVPPTAADSLYAAASSMVALKSCMTSSAPVLAAASPPVESPNTSGGPGNRPPAPSECVSAAAGATVDSLSDKAPSAPEDCLCFLSESDPAARLNHAHKEILEGLVRQEEARLAARHAREAEIFASNLSPSDLFVALVRGRQKEQRYHAPLFDRDHPAVDIVLKNPEILRLLLGFLRDPCDPSNLRDGALADHGVDFLAARGGSGRQRAGTASSTGPSASKTSSSRTGCSALSPSSSQLGAEATSSADFYVRAIQFSHQRLLRSFLQLYARNYPGDAVTVARIRAEIARLGHSDDEPVALLYFGTTTRSTPIGRALSDATAADQHCTISNFIDLLSKVQSSGPTSYGNFGEVTTSVYSLPALAQPAASVLDLNSILLEGLEMLGIASVSAIALNSARGGRLFRLDSAPLLEIRELVATHGADWTSLQEVAPVDEEIDPSRRAKIEQLMKRQLAFWRTHPAEAGKTLDPETEGGATALRAILADATSGQTRLGGRGFDTFEVILSKDVTDAGLEGRESYADDILPVARGPFLRAQVDQAVQGFDLAELFSLRRSAALFDLWAFNLRHKQVEISICFAVQILHAQRPLLLTTRSGKIASLVRTRSFEHALAPGSLADDFLAGRVALSLDVLGVLSPATSLKWRETQPDHAIKLVGTTAVVQYSHMPGDLALHVATMDEGFHAYDPLISDLAVDLIQLASAKVAFAREALCHLLASTYAATGVPDEASARRKFLRHARARCEARSVESGLEARLLAARERLATTFGALNAARQLSGSDRRLAADEDGERERRSESAQLGIANRAVQLEFLGPPLPAPVISVLDLYYYGPDGFLSPKLLSLEAHPLLGDPLDRAGLRPRLVQLANLLVQHSEAILDGLESPVSALPTTGAPVASREWVRWFACATEGAEVTRSASKAGWAGGRDWNLEARLAQAEQQRAREEQKRASRGLSVPGEMTPAAALERLREDRVPAASVGYSTRRAVSVTFCSGCNAALASQGGALQVQSHTCAGDRAFVSIRALFSPSLLLLLDAPTPAAVARPADLASLPVYSLLRARTALAAVPGFDAPLPFPPECDPHVHVSTTAASPALAVAAALDAFVIAHAGQDCLTASARARKLAGNDEACYWRSNMEPVLVELVSWLLDGDRALVIQSCSRCSQSLPTLATTAAKQHACEAAPRSASGRAARPKYDRVEEFEPGSSVLDLGLPLCRRVIAALADQNDAISRMLLSDESLADAPAALVHFASRVWAWRQPGAGDVKIEE